MGTTEFIMWMAGLGSVIILTSGTFQGFVKKLRHRRRGQR